jgi:hypothetical protein
VSWYALSIRRLSKLLNWLSICNTKALNGSAITIAAHVLDAMNEYGLDLKHVISLIEAKMEVSPLLVFCISHGYSGCSMQHMHVTTFACCHHQVQIRSI